MMAVHGSQKENRMNKKKPNDMQRYIKEVITRSVEIAKENLSITVEPEHLMSSVLEHLASAFVFNKMISAQINKLNAEIEALRRAVQNDKKYEIQE